MPKAITVHNADRFGELRADLLNAWQALNAARERFIAAVRADHSLPAWCEGERTAVSARTAAMALYGDFFYEGDMHAASVRRLIGLLAASRNTLKEAAKYNALKIAFGEARSSLQRYRWIDERQERHPLIRSAFQQIHIARVNTVEATRQIVVVRPDTYRLVWSVTKKPRVHSTTREHMIRLIESKQARYRVRLQGALRKLQRLPPRTPLAVYREGQPSFVANASFLDQYFNRGNEQYTSGIPMLIAHAPDGAFPECHGPRVDPVVRRPRERGRQIDTADFIAELRLRRYMS